MRMIMSLAVPALLLAGCATTPAEQSRQTAARAAEQDRLAQRLAGYTPGKPVDCIPHFQAEQSETFDNAVVYHTSNRTLYVNRFGGSGCNTHGGDDILVQRSYSSDICSGTIIRLLDRGSLQPDGSCVLGEFTPYTKSGEQ